MLTTRIGQRVAVTGLVVNVVLSVVKLLAGLLGHSAALIADAIESLTDIGGSLVIFSGLRIGSRPADQEHPYGHGKAESLAGLIVSLMILGAGLAVGIGAIRGILTPPRSPEPYTLGVLLSVAAIKECMFRWVRHVGQRLDSAAIVVDAWHHRSDALTSLAAAAGISIAVFGGPGYESADSWAALLAAILMMYNGARLIALPVRELMDAEPSELIDRARAVAEGVPGVRAVEKVYARKHGTRHWLDMHVHVAANLSVRDGHNIGGAVKAALRADIPSVDNVLIHIEPFEDGRTP
ncbi:MAG: cation transporter [Phycisphaerae bacterium]|nr:cation transporter [Phycisphaerae bacterium]